MLCIDVPGLSEETHHSRRSAPSHSRLEETSRGTWSSWSFGGVSSPRTLGRVWCQLNKPKTINPHSDSKLEIQAGEMRGEKSVVSKECTANTGVMKRNRQDGWITDKSHDTY